MTKQQQKTKTLRPSWKYFLPSYFYSILLIPLFGIGLIPLYFVWNRHHKFKYIIEDSAIRAEDGTYSQRIDLVSIRSLTVHQNWLERKLGVGSIYIETDKTEMKLLGLENPYNFKDTLDHAIAYQQKQQEKKEETQPRTPEFDPGEINRMNYLTGLWQQGLLSEEDFKNERSRHTTDND